MTYSIDQLKGAFVDSIVFNTNNIDQVNDTVSATDMKDEIFSSLTSESESFVIFCSHNYPGDSEATLFCFFPSAGRGSVCLSGLTEWFGATDMNDLEDQYLANLVLDD